MLDCTNRWARTLTQVAREQIKAARDAEVARLAAQGASGREIARQIGVAEGTVRNVTGAQKRNSSVSAHVGDDDSEPIWPPPASPASLAELANPASARWSDLLNRLRVLNEETDLDLLIAERRPKMEPRLVPAVSG